MMEYKGYLSRIEFDDEADIFHGEVVNTRDVITFQGQSVDELRQAFEDSVEDYLVFCAERGSNRKNRFQAGLRSNYRPKNTGGLFWRPQRQANG